MYEVKIPEQLQLSLWKYFNACAKSAWKLVFLYTCIYIPLRYLLKGEREIKELCYEIKQIFFFSFIDIQNGDIKHLMCGWSRDWTLTYGLVIKLKSRNKDKVRQKELLAF